MCHCRKNTCLQIDSSDLFAWFGRRYRDVQIEHGVARQEQYIHDLDGIWILHWTAPGSGVGTWFVPLVVAV